MKVAIVNWLILDRLNGTLKGIYLSNNVNVVCYNLNLIFGKEMREI